MTCASSFGQGYNWLELNGKLSKGDTLGAIFYLKDLLKDEGNGHWEAHYNLGLLYNKSDMKDSSIYHYLKASDLNKDLYQPHYSIGHYYFEKDEMDLAIHHYSLYLAKDPENWEVVHYRGQALMSIGDFFSAISDWTALINYEEEAGVVFNRGLSKLGMSDYEGSIEDFDRVIELEGNVIESRYYKGVCYEKLFSYKKAEKEWKHVIKLNPDHAKSYHRLAALYFAINKKKKVCANLNSAISLEFDIDLIDPDLLEFCR